ncbi:uncharacterized protein LOC116679871 isoform X2 [Etheostoma spectabile]|uniref:uncharacterized protein LOC116679871 isoform X2 n=1 Tax=Etheostoma spectabile TaxID=54343 RepID=UPI0013AF7B1A|nr:uncharacterized protein LOC116679871 isoform X2 [Etheostoma spectabile]
MEFWPENQGQSPLYSKFGTVPRRNCTHNYHDRHQVPHYPLYYGEQQDQGRESSHWTVPGSRTGGAPQEYTNWMDQEPTVPTSSQFPFILDRHVQQHQDLGDYQPHEGRDTEWIAAQRTVREYERGFLREGWQRRWEPCGPVRYNRDVSAKRSDSSYRELEAWAARYSHSLPRKKRIEAELRGASKGLLESSRTPERDSRIGTDPRVVALQQVRQSANIRESGLWDKGGRQQAPTYYSSQTPATDTSHMLDVKEKTGYQRKIFSQPPGYIAPPPYGISQKGSPVLHHCDTSWEQDGKRQANWSQFTPRKHDVSVDLQDHRKGEKEEFTKSEGNQSSFPEHRRQESDALYASSPFSIQETHLQYEGMLPLQQPQVLQAVENKKTNEEPSSKVIEGRKFRLNKKTGGMTIFCLVSRIAGTTETPSLPLCTSQTNTELGGVSKGLRDSSGSNHTHKLADEVDCREPSRTEQLNTSDARNVKAKQETPTCVESEMLEDKILNKPETDGVVPDKLKTNYAYSTHGRQVSESVQPVSLKYPLWREPSITGRAETKSSSKCLKANNEERESDGVHKQEDSSKVNSIDVEVRRLDIETDKESENSKVLLVIDTTCVVVKMELIPSPKKEHVHYLHTEHSPLDIQSTVSPECLQSDQNSESNLFQVNERPETQLHSGLMEKKAPEKESKISSFCMSSSSVSERETLEERAERILGIPLDDCTTKQQREDAKLILDSCVEDQEVQPSPFKDNNVNDAAEQIPEDTKEEEQSQNQFEVGQTEEAVCLQENDGAKDQVANEGAEDFAGLQVQVSNLSEENDSQIKTDIKPSPEIEMTEDHLLKPASEEGSTEQEENQPIENDTSSKCLSPPRNLSYPSLLSPSPDCEAPNLTLSLMLSSSDLVPLMHILEPNIEEGPDPELNALNSAKNLALHPETASLPYTPSPLPPGSNDFSLSSIPHTDHSPSPSPLDLIDQTAEDVVSVEDQVKEDEASQLINNEISDPFEDLAKDMTDELLLQQQFESGQSEDDDTGVNESSVTSGQQTEEADKDPTGHTMEPILKISKENAIEVDILQQQHGCVLAEDVTSVKESHMTEEQLPKEVDDDLTGLLEQTISQQYMTDSQIQKEVNILQQQFVDGQEEVAFLKESHKTEEQSQKEADEEPTGFMEETLSAENATESQTQIEIHILQDIEPQTETSNSSPPSTSDSDCGVSQSPDVLSPSKLSSRQHTSNESDAELVTPLVMDSVCPPPLNPDAAPAAGIPKTVPPLHLDYCEEPLQFLYSFSTDSPTELPSSSSTPFLQEGSGSVDPDLTLKEEPQYPKNLWDAVNRIRKHTAPDSENEEEDVSEPWDPESVVEDLDVIVGIHSKRIDFDGAGQQEVSTKRSVEDVEVGQIQADRCHEEPLHAEEDTLSCSSTCSQGSGDTVIVADKDEVEESPPDSGMESKAEGERCFSAKVKDETAAKEEGDNDANESVTNKSSQREECLVEMANMTMQAVEMTETEQEDEEVVVSVPS